MRAGHALLLLILAAPIASAHAVLQSADPAPNGHAEAGTTYLEIRFTENVERDYTDANVVDLDGESWKNGALQFDDKQRNVVRLPVRPLEDGIYSVSWQTLSVDSHTARGAYVFAAGNTTLKFAVDTPAHDHTEHSTARSVREGLARGSFYLGLFVAIGIPLFALVVDREREPPRRTHVVAGVFALLGASAAVVSLLLFADRTGLPLATALGTASGGSFVWRGGSLAAAGALLLLSLLAPPTARRNVATLAVLAAGAALVATALGSHAAAVKDQRLLSIAADAVHLLMGAVWVGGVIAFALASPGRSVAELGTLIRRFSPLAVGSVGLLLVTGTYASLRHIPAVSDLWTEDYGRLVLLKVALLAPLGALGYLNRNKLGPRFERGVGDRRLFRRVIAVEALLMVVIVGAAGVLASTPPPDAAVEQGTQGPPPVLELQQTTRTTHVILGVRPNPPTIGLQRITVALHPLTADPVPNATQVYLKVAPAGGPEPETIVVLEKISADEWSTPEDSYFTAPGEWIVYLTVQRPDEHAKLQFTVPVEAPT